MSDVVLKRGMERVEVKAALVTTEILRRTFRVDPSEVWLRIELDNRALYPDDLGHFNLQEAHLPFGAVLGVEGPNIPMGASPRMTISTTAQSSQGGSSSSFNSAPQAPAFKSVIPKSSLKEQRVTIKIVRASMETLPNGKVEFTSQAQMHLDISESNANIGHITKEVQECWGNEYVLVTTDGLLHEDCDATQGLKFWKSPRRKVFAVPNKKVKGKSRKKRDRDIALTDSDDDIDPAPKRGKDGYSAIICRVESTVNDTREDIESIKEAIQDILHLNSRSKLPLGILSLLRDAFQCKICLEIPVKPPAIVSKCCKTIIGCERCVNEWYSGSDALTKTCPSCRAERGYSETLILRGLDGFLLEAKKVIDCEAGNDNESDGDEFPVVLP